jgi:hypothetical protein
LKTRRSEAYEAHVVQAEACLRVALANGPVSARDVKASAPSVRDRAWQTAKERLGVVSIRVPASKTWHWTIPGAEDFENALAEWLSTPQGRFARYVAKRDRLRESSAPGEPLALDETRATP